MSVRTELLTGMNLVTSLWGAIGVVTVFGALVFIVFKFFIGQGKNTGQGILAIVVVGVVASLASSPQSVIDAGTAIGKLVGLG